MTLSFNYLTLHMFIFEWVVGRFIDFQLFKITDCREERKFFPKALVSVSWEKGGFLVR